MAKVKDHFEVIVIDKQANKFRNVVLSSTVTFVKAFALLHKSNGCS